MFANRAYPINKQILNDIIAVRDEIAHLLGFGSHAAYELDNEMVKSVDRAESFLSDVLKRATKKEQEEMSNELDKKARALVTNFLKGIFFFITIPISVYNKIRRRNKK